MNTNFHVLIVFEKHAADIYIRLNIALSRVDGVWMFLKNNAVMVFPTYFLLLSEEGKITSRKPLQTAYQY